MRNSSNPKSLVNSVLSGHFVAQVRLVFTPLFASETEMSAHGNEYFAYVEPLEPPPDSLIDGVHVPDDGVGLFRVKRSHAADKSRNGLIINLKDIWRRLIWSPSSEKNVQGSGIHLWLVKLQCSSS